MKLWLQWDLPFEHFPGLRGDARLWGVVNKTEAAPPGAFILVGRVLYPLVGVEEKSEEELIA